MAGFERVTHFILTAFTLAGCFLLVVFGVAIFTAVVVSLFLSWIMKDLNP